MPKILFKKGVSGNPAGRPVGSLEKPWLRPEYWHDLVIKEWAKLEPNERASIAMKGFSTVLPRTIGPQTPEQSAQNAESAFKMLKLLQEISRNGTNSRINSAGTSNSLVNGGPETQASETPTLGL